MEKARGKKKRKEDDVWYEVTWLGGTKLVRVVSY